MAESAARFTVQERDWLVWTTLLDDVPTVKLRRSWGFTRSFRR